LAKSQEICSCLNVADKENLIIIKLTKLLIIRILHTLVWVFFNAVLAYLFYAVIINKIDKCIWIGLGLFVLEAIILVLFKMICPLTIMARKYSDSDKENFDIFLPEWLAKHNKTIYTGLLGVVIIILIYRLITNE
jgi:hypothetical protein